jgi:phosphoglycolate phosphatase-like HAD superfamily hydrolase
VGLKPIIGFDFDGSIIRSVASEAAHFEWFETMAVLLDDEKVKKLAGQKDYFPEVYRLMERYTGLSQKNASDKEIMTKIARNLYQLSTLGCANKHKKNLLFKDVSELILKLKKKYQIALITTVPGDIVLPILRLIDFDKFDLVQTTPITEKPDKLKALERFTKEKGKPILYVGNSIDDITACKKLGIKSVLAMWGGYDKDAVKKADFTAKSANDLKQILEKL